jgi:hypothetical protein
MPGKYIMRAAIWIEPCYAFTELRYVYPVQVVESNPQPEELSNIPRSFSLQSDKSPHPQSRGWGAPVSKHFLSWAQGNLIQITDPVYQF